MGSDSRKQTVRGKEATRQVLFSHEGTDYLVVWRMDTTPNGLERYLVRPRTHGTPGEPLEAEVVPPRAPRWAHLRLDEAGRPLGILHRAVSPHAIRIGWTGAVKLGDFASAYSLLPQRLRTPNGLFRGELEYAAPERLEQPGTAVPDARTDLFSLGVVLLEALTGHCIYGLESLEEAAGLNRGHCIPRPVRRAERPSWATPEEMAALAAALRPEHVEEALQGVSAPVKRLVHLALRRDPDERYASAARFQADLQSSLQAVRPVPYDARAASLELLQARTEAEGSPRREGATLTEWGVFSEDLPMHS